MEDLRLFEFESGLDWKYLICIIYALSGGHI